MNLWSSDLAPQLHSRVLLLFYLTANILDLIVAFVQVRKNKLCSDILLKKRFSSKLMNVSAATEITFSV